MQLHVGIIGQEEFWRALLRQEGVPASAVHGHPDARIYTVLAVGGQLDSAALTAVRSYLNSGGAVITPSVNAPHLAGLRLAQRRLRTLYPHHDQEFAGLEPVDLELRCRVPFGSNILRTASSDRTGFIGRVGSGHLVVLPFDVSVVFGDARSSAKSFYAPASRLPFETAATVSKGSARGLVMRCVELLFHRRGFPYAHLWYYPDGAPSVFGFRVDTDAGTAEQVDALASLTSSAGVRTTWFLDVKSQISHLSRYAGMTQDEIGVHCYEHRRYDDAGRISSDLAAAIKHLQEAGIRPAGFAAPYGTWNEAVGKAVRDAGLAYSSEFSYDYDNLPSWPTVAGEAGALQIPVHPICIGNMRRQGYEEIQMAAYFSRVLEAKMRRREPVFFYHHPRDGHWPVLKLLFEKIAASRIPNLTLGEMAAWWKERADVDLRLEYDRGMIAAEGNEKNGRMMVRISKADGTETIVPLDTVVALADAKWTLRERAEIPKDIERARRFNYRIPLVKGLDAVVAGIRSVTRKKWGK